MAIEKREVLLTRDWSEGVRRFLIFSRCGAYWRSPKTASLRSKNSAVARILESTK